MSTVRLTRRGHFTLLVLGASAAGFSAAVAILVFLAVLGAFFGTPR